jgi:hypothetical protein
MLKRIRRSPHGPFKKDEILLPDQIAFLIKKPQRNEERRHPRWLNLLRQLFRGIFTFEGLFLLILALTVFLRFYRLDLKLFHHDEAIHAWFAYRLLHEGIWTYDPRTTAPSSTT